MDGEREELSGVGIERRREGATEQGREGYFKECILRRALTSMYITNHRTTRLLPLRLWYYKLKIVNRCKL